jgi:hypothetical protein
MVAIGLLCLIKVLMMLFSWWGVQFSSLICCRSCHFVFCFEKKKQSLPAGHRMKNKPWFFKTMNYCLSVSYTCVWCGIGIIFTVEYMHGTNLHM